MNSRILVLLALGVVISLPASEDCAASATNGSAQTARAVMDRYHEIATQIDAAFLSGDIAAIERMGEDIRAFLPPSKASIDVLRKWRRGKLTLWLRALEKVREATDPAFNPDDVPQINIAPPGADDGVPTSGVDPKTIKDPKLRKEYERLLEENSRAAERYRYQSTLRKLDRYWTNELKAHVDSHYADSQQDRIEIFRLIEQEVRDGDVREKFRSMLVDEGA